MRTIGIDFGTTKTIASWVNPKTRVAETLRCFNHEAIVPTQVYIPEEGSIQFGEKASLRGTLDSEGTYDRFKLNLGSGDGLVFRQGTIWKAVDLTAKFLQYVKSACADEIGEICGAVVTVPASFSVAQNEELRHAAEVAGFEDVKIALEPEAAAIAYMKMHQCELARALVVDWGGGTLDTALVEKDANGNYVCDRRYSRGRADIGGEEMDRKFVNFVMDRFREKGVRIPDPKTLLDSSTEEAAAGWGEWYNLRKSILKDKCKLDVCESEMFYPVGIRGESVGHNVEISQEDFRQVIKKELDEACELMSEVMRSIPRDMMPEKLLLAGGTCRSRVIQDALREASGLEIIEWQNSREAVSLGAAYQDVNVNPEPERVEDKICVERPKYNPLASRFRRF